jgi:FHA domain
VIGRHEKCDFVVDGATVSNVHCRVWAFDSGTGEMLVCCEVSRSNGVGGWPGSSNIDDVVPGRFLEWNALQWTESQKAHSGPQ